MSINMQKLVKLLKENDDLLQKLKATEKVEDFIEIVKENGINFTECDIEVPEEFQDYDLDNLAGGCCGCSNLLFDGIVQRYRLKELNNHWTDIKNIILK